MNLGLFYIACKGSTDGKSSTPSITVKFIPSETTKSAISKVTIEQTDYSEPAATISQILDIDTGNSKDFCKQTGNAPVKSQTPDVTYIALDDNLEPKSISVYKDRIKQYEIDLDKPHHGMKPHVHHCKSDGYRKPKENDSDMLPTEHDKKLIKLLYAFTTSTRSRLQENERMV